MAVTREQYHYARRALTALYLQVPEEVAKDVYQAMVPLLTLAHDQLPPEDNPTRLPHISGPDQ